MPKTSLVQKTALILLGLILTIVILEAGLRLGGFVLTAIQEHRNRVAISRRGNHRILCLGESTTARQYPHYLEEILNQSNGGIKFNVIDKGFVGTKTDTIVALLESNLETYHPDIVITMMGINDNGPHMPYETTSDSKVIGFLKSSRTYKLARLLWLHLAARFAAKPFAQQAAGEVSSREVLSEYEKLIEEGSVYREQQRFSEASDLYRKAIALDPKKDKAYYELGNFYRKQGKFSETVYAYKKAIKLNPKNGQAYFELGYVYRELRRFPEAEAAYKKAIELNPEDDNLYYELGDCYGDVAQYPESEVACRKAIELNPKNYDAYRELGDACKNQGKFAEAEEAYKVAIALNPEDYRAYPKLGKFYQQQGRFSEAVALFEKLIEQNPYNDKAYGALGAAHREMGKTDLAEKYSNKAIQLRSNLYDPNTVNNYRKLREILKEKKITYVCAQYPMRDVTSFKKIFDGNIEGIIFVDNEKIFKDAVRKEGYAVYFGDMFGGDFGHCTEKGNRLLAKNIADTILREVFDK